MTWISIYNPKGIGDVLLVSGGQASTTQVVTKTVGDVTQIKNEKTGAVVGYNIQQAAQYFQLDKELTSEEAGLVTLSSAQEKQLNDLIEKAGFEAITLDNSPKFVVGYVESCVDHPDSDHLHVTKTQVGEGVTLQIVCGAPNVKAGQKVVVAKPGAMMPSGKEIWASELRGIESYGMICSERELNLANASQKRGILVLEDDANIGEPFEINTAEKVAV